MQHTGISIIPSTRTNVFCFESVSLVSDKEIGGSLRSNQICWFFLQVLEAALLLGSGCGGGLVMMLPMNARFSGFDLSLLSELPRVFSLAGFWRWRQWLLGGGQRIWFWGCGG